MKSRVVPSPKKPPNLIAYEKRFGHRPSPEARRSYTLNQLDQIAKEALSKGEPIPQWRDRSKTRVGNVNDQMYKNLEFKSKFEEVTYNESLSKTLEKYLHLFGHIPDENALKNLSKKELDKLARNALKTGFPVESWKKSNPFPLSYIGGMYFSIDGGYSVSNFPWYHKPIKLFIEVLPQKFKYRKLKFLIDEDFIDIRVNHFIHHRSEKFIKEGKPYKAYYHVEGKVWSGKLYQIYKHRPLFKTTDNFLLESDYYNPKNVNAHLMSNISGVKQYYPTLEVLYNKYEFSDDSNSAIPKPYHLSFMDWEPLDEYF